MAQCNIQIECETVEIPQIQYSVSKVYSVKFQQKVKLLSLLMWWNYNRFFAMNIFYPLHSETVSHTEIWHVSPPLGTSDICNLKMTRSLNLAIDVQFLIFWIHVSIKYSISFSLKQAILITHRNPQRNIPCNGEKKIITFMWFTTKSNPCCGTYVIMKLKWTLVPSWVNFECHSVLIKSYTWISSLFSVRVHLWHRQQCCYL